MNYAADCCVVAFIKCRAMNASGISVLFFLNKEEANGKLIDNKELLNYLHVNYENSFF